MESNTFKALLISETPEKQYVKAIVQRQISDLPADEILIKVHYSSLNYKDALSSTGNKGVTRNYPHTPGIDAAGVIEKSDSPDFQVGEEVIVTSYDLGMNTSGGLAEYIRVPAAWVVRLPEVKTLQYLLVIKLLLYYYTMQHLSPICLCSYINWSLYYFD